MPDLDTLQRRLCNAEEALHNLQTGTLAVEVEVAGGLRTTFKAPALNELVAYVKELRDLVAGCDRPRHGAINIIF